MGVAAGVRLIGPGEPAPAHTDVVDLVAIAPAEAALAAVVRAVVGGAATLRVADVRRARRAVVVVGAVLDARDAR